jgi:pilus assembly protein Flp/PilA
MLFKLCEKLRALTSREEGQDLVEYAMVVALIAFGTISGMGKVASGINNVFSTVSTTLGSSIS